MRFLVSLLLFFPLMSFACSNTAEQRELKSYALVLSKGELLEVAVYFPSEVEKAKASSTRVAYMKNNKVVLWVATMVETPYQLENEPKFEGYSVSYLVVNAEKINEIELAVQYSFPTDVYGGVTMCGPVRNYKLSELLSEKL